MVAPEDIAVYGGLCALATFSREEMKRKVLDNAAFKNFLDLVPQVCRVFMYVWCVYFFYFVRRVCGGLEARREVRRFACGFVGVFGNGGRLFFVWLCVCGWGTGRGGRTVHVHSRLGL